MSCGRQCLSHVVEDCAVLGVVVCNVECGGAGAHGVSWCDASSFGRVRDAGVGVVGMQGLYCSAQSYTGLGEGPLAAAVWRCSCGLGPRGCHQYIDKPQHVACPCFLNCDPSWYGDNSPVDAVEFD